MVFLKGWIMQGTRITEEILKMRFDDVMDDTKGNICGRTDEAAALLGISVRTAGFEGV